MLVIVVVGSVFGVALRFVLGVFVIDEGIAHGLNNAMDGGERWLYPAVFVWVIACCIAFAVVSLAFRLTAPKQSD